MFKVKKISCLIFDLDNTLVSCSPLVRPYFVWRLCAAYKSYASPFHVIQGLYRAAYIMRNMQGDRDNYQRIVEGFAAGSGIDYFLCMEIFERSLPVILRSCKEYFRPIKAAKSFIEQLNPAMNLGLATNSLWPEFFARLRLEWALLDPNRFIWITHAHNMNSCKPHLDYYKKILQINKEQKIDLNSYLFIGNDQQQDGPAVDAGITTIILSTRPGFKLIRPANLSRAALFQADWRSIGMLFGVKI